MRVDKASEMREQDRQEAFAADMSIKSERAGWGGGPSAEMQRMGAARTALWDSYTRITGIADALYETSLDATNARNGGPVHTRPHLHKLRHLHKLLGEQIRETALIRDAAHDAVRAYHDAGCPRYAADERKEVAA